MADEKDTSTVFPESFFQLVFCIHIQMIGWLIQKQNVGITVYQFTETNLSLLTTALDTDLTFDVFGCKAAFCQRGTDFILGK